jgi:hypothetical protein
VSDRAGRDEWVGRVLGIAVRGDMAARGEKAEDQAAVLRERLDICTQDMRRIAEPTVRGVMIQSVSGIETILRRGDTQGAAKLIDRLESQIAEAVRTARREEARRQAGSLVQFAQVSLKWREAQQTFNGNLVALGAKVLAMPEVQADPRYATVEEAVRALPRLVPKFSGDLEDALDAGANATDPAEKAKSAAKAAGAIEAYRRVLNGAPFLFELERFAERDLRTAMPLHSALDKALAELKQKISP